MGVPGMKTLFDRHPYWRTNVRLKECKLVIDVTDGMYWFLKSRLLVGQEKMDRFGFSMVRLSQLLKQYFERFKLAKITPIIVYNGSRLSEKTYGPLVSKTKHLEKSAQIRMYKMSRYGTRNLNDDIIPELASNVLKQVINELQLEAHQSTYEVYPLLVRLANENDCSVLTSHRDFILADVKRGFLLFEEFDLASSKRPQQRQLESEIDSGCLYRHQLMLSAIRIPSQCSPALYCLNVLLRPDFCGRYFEVMNRMFNMPGNLQFQHDITEFVQNHRFSRQPWARRVEFILTHWPIELTDSDSVRRTFEQLAGQVFNRSQERDVAMRDYDALYLSFSDSNDHENIAALLPEHLGQIVGLQDALTKRESTALFLTDILMGQTNIDRLRIEDTSTFRSTYSLADPVKLLLMNRGTSHRQRAAESLRLFDRQYSSLQHRTLQLNSHTARQQQQVDDFEAPDQMLYDVFLFPGQISSPSNLRQFIRESKQTADQLMKVSLAFKDDERQQSSMCEQLIVLLRLVMFSIKLGLRDNYELPKTRSRSRSSSSPPQPAAAAAAVAIKSSGGLPTTGSKSQSGSLTDKLKPTESKYRKILPQYLDAVYNSFMYHSFKQGLLKDRNEESELLRNDLEGGFYAKVNLAVQEIDSNKISKPSDVSNNNYMEIKHLNEMLNSSLHAYMELNSFYNHPGAVLKLADYYDCHQIYKICHYMLQTNKQNTSLLTIEQTDRLHSLVSDI